jgi:two-component system, NarL family, sensor histidine kinase UhpB
VSLFGKVVAINAGAIIAAALLLVISPATISARPRATEIVVLAVGTVVLLGVNVWLVRRAFEPLERLAALMRQVDPHEPGRRIQLDGAVNEVADVSQAFNAMLDRLEQERVMSGRRALMAQENERKRLARELHDEVGQTLTGVMLQLEGIHRAAPPELGEAVAQLQETAREGVEEVREIARGLRPQALDEFGLRSALATLAAGFEERTRVRTRVRVAPDLPALASEQDLAVYRVAQESLTNVARHAGARSVELSLSRVVGGVLLRVADDGRGITPEQAAGDSSGVGGMRERALLIGGSLGIRALRDGGTEVTLALPVKRWPGGAGSDQGVRPGGETPLR